MNQRIAQRLLALGLFAMIFTACGGNEPAASATPAPSPTTVETELVAEPASQSTVETAEAVPTAVLDGSSAEIVQIVSACNAFLDNTTTICEADTAFVESDGLPTTHNMMVGIVSWQQQVPLPQAYTGDNAWQIPLAPELSDNPISAANEMFRGAIALAVNGVPIFNALNNRGDDAYLAGELDQWGGHSGRADDYHYHIAPTHLQEVVGADQPIAYGLDGFPIYGLTEPDGSSVVRFGCV